jgi:mannose-6-phosphate isomerase-like protein (cupin superfamily)
MNTKPHLVEFPKIGNSQLGYISVAENQTLPFEVKRIYWTYYTPESVERGGHSHYELQQILVAVAGKIIVTVESLDGEINEFILENPNQGLYIPKNTWRTMKYTHSAVQMCIASEVYSEADYIRTYSEFKKIKQ